MAAVRLIKLDGPTGCDRVGCTTPATLQVVYVNGAFSFNCDEHARERAPELFAETEQESTS